MKISLYNTKKVYMHSISYRIGQDPSYKHCQKPTDERFVSISTTVDAFSSVEHEIPWLATLDPLFIMKVHDWQRLFLCSSWNSPLLTTLFFLFIMEFSMVGDACSFVHHGILHDWQHLFLCSSWNSTWLATLVPWFIMEFSMIGDACSFVHHGILHDWRHLFFCSSWNSMIGDAWFSLRHVIPWLKTFFFARSSMKNHTKSVFVPYFIIVIKWAHSNVNSRQRDPYSLYQQTRMQREHTKLVEESINIKRDNIQMSWLAL